MPMNFTDCTTSQPVPPSVGPSLIEPHPWLISPHVVTSQFVMFIPCALRAQIDLLSLARCKKDACYI